VFKLLANEIPTALVKLMGNNKLIVALRFVFNPGGLKRSSVFNFSGSSSRHKTHPLSEKRHNKTALQTRKTAKNILGFLKKYVEKVLTITL